MTAVGERALLCAILEDAIRCLAGEGRPARERWGLAGEARAWFEARDREWPFSFECVCEALDLDAGQLRSRLLRAAPAVPSPEESRDNGRRAGSPRSEDLVRMIRAGHSLRVVAEAFGISVSRASVLSGGFVERMRAERDTEIRRLRTEGWTPQALATRFGLSRIRIVRICARRSQPKRGPKGGWNGAREPCPPASARCR